jgi:hypothetical protein
VVSVVATGLLLGLAVVGLLRARLLPVGPAVVAVLFGFVLALTPAGPVVSDLLDRAGTAAWSALTNL